MKSNSKKIVILIILGMSFVFLPNIEWNFSYGQKSNDINPKSSGGYSESFIHIDGSIPNNWSDTTSEDWCSGDGSWGNPYTIENVTVDCGGTGSGILIENSDTDYFIIRNCTVYHAGSGTYDAGIKLENTNKGTLTNNNCSNNERNGILLYNDSDNNTILGNTANDNSFIGIYLRDYCDNNTISGNTANDNGERGIYLDNDCDNNTISGNTANDNTDFGIILTTNCDDNTISGNSASNVGTTNQNGGIYLSNNCDNNTISGNTANNNTVVGIILDTNCDNNTISGNSASNVGTTNQDRGIHLSINCDNNTIYGNTANNNTLYGIYLFNDCDNNTISGNTANNNSEYGIYIQTNSDDNTISGNTANNNTLYGIYLWFDCDTNTIYGNTANDNGERGIYLDNNCDNNNITENYFYFNTFEAIRIDTADCDNTLIKANILVSRDSNFFTDRGTNTLWKVNYFGTSPPSIVVEVLAQSFSTTVFIMTFNVSSQLIYLEVSALSIQAWWNGTLVPSNDITELGNGLYNISLTPILVNPGDPPILLNMTISAAYHTDKYYELELAVDPEAVDKGGDGGDDDDDDDDDDYDDYDDDDDYDDYDDDDDDDDDGISGDAGLTTIIVLSIAAILGVAAIAIFLKKKKR